MRAERMRELNVVSGGSASKASQDETRRDETKVVGGVVTDGEMKGRAEDVGIGRQRRRSGGIRADFA